MFEFELKTENVTYTRTVQFSMVYNAFVATPCKLSWYIPEKKKKKPTVADFSFACDHSYPVSHYSLVPKTVYPARIYFSVYFSHTPIK